MGVLFGILRPTRMSVRRVCTFLLAALIVSIPLWFPTVTFAQAGEILRATGDGLLWVLANGLNIIVSAIGFLVYWAGQLFEYTLNYTLYTRYTNVEAVQDAWTLLRDLLNIVFIFLLLYIAISTILNADTTGWRKQVVQIIVAAIFVNFSLFLTGVVVDAGNILAINFHEVVTTCEPPQDPAEDNPCGDDGTQSIATSLMFGMGLQETFAENAWGPNRGTLEEHAIRNALIRIVLLTLVLWAFVSIFLLFLVRTIMILFLFVTAPIGMAGASVPILQDKSKQWRQQLFQQTFVPVVFLLFMFFILQLVAEAGVFETSSEVAAGGDISTNPDTEGSVRGEDLFTLLILVGLMIAAVRITRSLSSQLSQTLEGWGKAAVGLGVGTLAGGAAVGARTIAGGAASHALKNENLQKRAAQGNVFAKAGLGAANWTSKQSFDARHAPGAQTALKHAGMEKTARGVGPLSSQQTKGGLQARRKQQQKSAAEFSELLGHDKEREQEIMGEYEAENERMRQEVQEEEETLQRDRERQWRSGTFDQQAYDERRRKIEEKQKNLRRRTSKEAVDSERAKTKARLQAERKEKYAQNLESQPGFIKRITRIGVGRTDDDPAVKGVREQAGKDRRKGGPIDQLKEMLNEEQAGQKDNQQGGSSSGNNA